MDHFDFILDQDGFCEYFIESWDLKTITRFMMTSSVNNKNPKLMEQKNKLLKEKQKEIRISYFIKNNWVRIGSEDIAKRMTDPDAIRKISQALICGISDEQFLDYVNESYDEIKEILIENRKMQHGIILYFDFRHRCILTRNGFRIIIRDLYSYEFIKTDSTIDDLNISRSVFRRLEIFKFDYPKYKDQIKQNYKATMIRGFWKYTSKVIVNLGYDVKIPYNVVLNENIQDMDTYKTYIIKCPKNKSNLIYLYGSQ